MYTVPRFRCQTALPVGLGSPLRRRETPYDFFLPPPAPPACQAPLFRDHSHL